MIRDYVRDVLSDPIFWTGGGMVLWVIGLCMLGVGR